MFSLFLVLNSAAACSNGEWSTCGGNDYTGETCCPTGTDCHEMSEWYSQCLTACPSDQGWACYDPAESSSSSSDDDCDNGEWQQCAGEGYSGPTCCPSGTQCFEKSLYYSQCLTECPAVGSTDESWTCQPTPTPPIESSSSESSSSESSSSEEFTFEGADCSEVSFSWTQTGQWSQSYQGTMSMTLPEPANWFLVLESPADAPALDSISWYDGPTAEHLNSHTIKLDPYDDWWNNIVDVEFGMIITGVDPLETSAHDQLNAFFCKIPVDMSLFLDSANEHDLKASVVGIVGLLAQSMWESGGDAPWTACDENNYTHSDTASCSQRGDGQQYNDVQSAAGCFIDPDMHMVAETYATWTDGPMECTPGTVTEGCCWWGRGAIQTTGPHNYGVLQRDVVSNMDLPATEFDDNLCTNPEAICQIEELKNVGAAYYWTTVVQNESCYVPSLDAYVTSDFAADAVHAPCYGFSSGIGGSVNNGVWNSDAHEDGKRVQNFETLMAPVKEAFESFTLGSTIVSGADECTGNPEVDYILEEAKVENVSGIGSASSVYTWNGFCLALRQMGHRSFE